MKPLIIVGPTSSGKTALALWLAEQFSNVDILVIDSKQVYRHQDIVSGKDLEENFNPSADGQKPKSNNQTNTFYSDGKTRIFGIDLVEPDEEWSVAQSIAYVEAVVKESREKGRFLIIVGGTPQYVLSVFEQPVSFVIQPDEKLRASLEKLSLQELQKRLQTVDYKRYEGMNHSDQNNPRRLIRAIEIRASEFTGELAKPLLLISDCLWIGLSPSKTTLESRIRERVCTRIDQGALKEFRSLSQNYPKWTKEAKATIGYKEIGSYENEELSKEQLIDLWTLHEVQYAKRQMTWWKREHQIVWYDALEVNLNSQVLQHVKDCYNR